MSLAVNRARAFATDGALLVSSFLRWWRDELQGIYDEFARERGHRGRLTIAPAEILLTWQIRGQQRSAHAPRPTGTEDLPQAVERLIRGSGIPLTHIDLTLSPEAVLGRCIPLPLAAKRRLREAVGYQLGRLSPLKPELIYFDCVPVQEEQERRRIIAEFTITRRGAVDALADAVLATQVPSVRIVGPSNSAETGAPVFLRKSKSRVWQLDRVDRLFLYAGVVLATLIALTCFFQWYHEANRIEQEIGALRVRAATAAELREKVETRIGQQRLLAGPTIDHAAVIAELTRLLPADAWLFQYQCEGAALQISGFASNASAVSVALSKSTMFASVALRSSIKAPGTESERFDVAIQLKASPPA